MVAINREIEWNYYVITYVNQQILRVVYPIKFLAAASHYNSGLSSIDWLQHL